MIEIKNKHGVAIRSVPGNSLVKANLSGADLRDADLVGADLRDADLYGANLRGADLHGADLVRANLCGADLRGAYLSADLTSADLRSADLRGAYLVGANLHDANLAGANFRCATLTNANLIGADLRGADFNGAEMSGTLVRESDLNTVRVVQVEPKAPPTTEGDPPVSFFCDSASKLIQVEKSLERAEEARDRAMKECAELDAKRSELAESVRSSLHGFGEGRHIQYMGYVFWLDESGDACFDKLHNWFDIPGAAYEKCTLFETHIANALDEIDGAA